MPHVVLQLVVGVVHLELVVGTREVGGRAVGVDLQVAALAVVDVVAAVHRDVYHRAAAELSAALQHRVRVELDGGEAGTLDHHHFHLANFSVRRFT